LLIAKKFGGVFLAGLEQYSQITSIDYPQPTLSNFFYQVAEL